MLLSEIRGLAPVSVYHQMLDEFKVFITWNVARIGDNAIDEEAKAVLDEMTAQFRKPAINGMMFSRIPQDILENPKFMPAILKYVHDMLKYIAPRIQRYVKSEYVQGYMDRLNQIGMLYTDQVKLVTK